MTKTLIQESARSALKEFLRQNPFAELVETYLFFVEKKFGIKPVIFIRDKKIFLSEEEAIASLVKEGKLWHETEIKVTFSKDAVNEQTKKVYICPFSGKVFGDNTHTNPQDAIYDWVSKCPENKERVGGLKSKRFFVSEDPDVIANYIPKVKPKEAIKKVVFSSVLNGKLFNSKENVLEDFKKNYLKPMTLHEVQEQNRFEIDGPLLAFIQEHLVEDKITSFVEALSQYEEFNSVVAQWVEAE